MFIFLFAMIFSPQMIYKCKRSRSNLKKFEVEYFKNGTRKRDGANRSQIGSPIWAFE